MSYYRDLLKERRDNSVEEREEGREMRPTRKAGKNDREFHFDRKIFGH